MRFAYNRSVRFQTKIKDRSVIDPLLEQLAESSESSYLWCHHEGRLIIYDAHLTSWDITNRQLNFKFSKSLNRNPLSALTGLNLFHEGLLLIFKAPIIGHTEDSLQLKAPEAILKLAQAEDFLPELLNQTNTNAPDGVDATDLELISQVLEVINSPKPEAHPKDKATAGPTYAFAKKPEIKETSGTFAFSNKGVVEDNFKSVLDENKSNSKKMRVGIARPGMEPSIYQLLEVETHKVIFQTIIKGEFKESDEITVHSLYDNPLTNPLKAKIISFTRPSEYAKAFRVEARFEAAKEGVKPKKKEVDKVGVKRILAVDTFSHEVLYVLNDMNTNGLILAEKRGGEFHVADKVIISNLYGSPLKKPITAQIKSIQDTADGRLISLEFLKPD